MFSFGIIQEENSYDLYNTEVKVPMFSFGTFHEEKHLQFFFFQTENVFKALQDITEELRKLKFPDGSKESPARTCQQIKKNNPDAQDGNKIKIIIFVQ